ncbi:MAG TPA: hypothetical protein VE643_07975 [Nitrososphaeraceae archaeon]|nr:hypothetical protein [Nitrososphaeraceae archaeon]
MFRLLIPAVAAGLSISILFQTGFANLVLAIAEPLLPINTGNVGLDSNIPKFFSCIKKAVKQNVNIQDSYFKHEPTKDEVIKCYHDVIASGNVISAEKVNNGE